MEHHQSNILVDKILKSALLVGCLMSSIAFAQIKAPAKGDAAMPNTASERPPGLVHDEVGSWSLYDKGLLSSNLRFGKPRGFHLTVLNLAAKDESEAKSKTKNYQEKSKLRFSKNPDRAQISIVIYNDQKDILVETQGEIPAHIKEVWIPSLLSEYKNKKQRAVFYINEQILRLNQDERLIPEYQNTRLKMSLWIWGVGGLFIGILLTLSAMYLWNKSRVSK